MLLENVDNVVSLLATIVGLLGCLFRYVKAPRRGYLFLIGFFLASFFSDYHWTIYTLVMGDYPDVSEFLAYLGWNLAYPLLLLAVLTMRAKGARRFFHPLMLWPVLTNAAQFVLYIQFGAILNNIWQVGVTTAIMVFCMQDLLYYHKNRKNGAKTPYLSLLVLLFFIVEYGMWTVSCFDWPGELLDPYPYLAVLASVIAVFFGRAAGRVYRSETPDAGWTEYRYQAMLQAVFTTVICGACAVGYWYAVRMRQALPEQDAVGAESLVRMLLVTSLVLILAVSALVCAIGLRYRRTTALLRPDAGTQGRSNYLVTIAITLLLMAAVVFYNSRTLYSASVAGAYEDGRVVDAAAAAQLENYLTVAETTLRVTSDTVEMMARGGASHEEVLAYLTEQTRRRAEQFGEEFTGLYACLDGAYLDGAGWVPPEGYDPMSRIWYQTAVRLGGEVAVLLPYEDAQTGSAVITLARSIPTGSPAAPGVAALDVLADHVRQITEQVDIGGKGYAMVVAGDGTIVAHRDGALNARNVADVYGEDFAALLAAAGTDRFTAELRGEQCVVFTQPVLDEWTCAVIVSRGALLHSVRVQIAINAFVSALIFLIVSLFYYFSYKIEQDNAKKIKDMDMQVVGALASAIDAKDAYTNGHSARVAKYARMIAGRAGYSAEEQDKIYMMGLLHDVGKIGVPDEVINKPGRLTEEEFELIRSHPVVGGRILEGIKERPELATGARWHHERYAGGGYPDGIAGEEIPEAARIIAVADAYDAMTSRRSYREPMPQEKVRAEIVDGSGTQFDPRFAHVMLRIMDEDKDFALREN